MSNKAEVNRSYIQRITSLIENKKSAQLEAIVNELHAADIAEIIECLSNQHAKYFYNLITSEESQRL